MIVTWCGFILLPGHAVAAGPETDVSVRSWTTEQFGSDVAILRSDDAGSEQRPRGTALLLSCSGPDRRFRLSLPDAVSKTDTDGWALIAAAGSSDRSREIVRFKLADASTIVVASATPQGQDVVVAVGRMLLKEPRALDIFLSLGPSPVAFTKLKVVRVLLSLKPEDIEDVTRFVDACGRSPAARNN